VQCRVAGRNLGWRERLSRTGLNPTWKKLPASINCGRETFSLSDYKSASGRFAKGGARAGRGPRRSHALHPISVKRFGARVPRPALTLPAPASRPRALLAGAPRWSIPEALALDRASIRARPGVRCESWVRVLATPALSGGHPRYRSWSMGQWGRSRQWGSRLQLSSRSRGQAFDCTYSC